MIPGAVLEQLEWALTSYVGLVAERAGFVDAVFLQLLLVPGSAVQRIPQPQELPEHGTKHRFREATTGQCSITVV